MISDCNRGGRGDGLFRPLSSGRNLVLIIFGLLTLSLTSLAQDPPDPAGKGKNPYILEDRDEEAPAPRRGRVRRAPQRQKTPALAIYWQLLTIDKQNQESAVAPSREFSDGDLVRLAVQVNQDGYLYLVKHTIDKDGQSSPPALVSKEVAKVARNEVVELPFGCDSKSMRNGKCWWKVRKPAGREVITAVFSRTRVDKIAEIARTNSGEEIYVSENLLFQITQESPLPQRQVWTSADQYRNEPQALRGGYITKVWNPQPQIRELLVVRIEFAHR